ncbi:MAG: hypothetical protein Q9166_007904 [cf. Caloplaca sp. 2 TL-2023]
MANLTCLVYQHLKRLKSHPVAASNMVAKGVTLPISSRSGHPVYPFGNIHDPPVSQDPVSEQNSLFSIEVSPDGTWKKVRPGPGLPSVEVLNLTNRFAYVPKEALKTAKGRPKNALKRGRKPTKTSELPLRKKSWSTAINAMAAMDEEGQVLSEPIPVKLPMKAFTTENVTPSLLNSMAATRTIYRQPSNDNEEQTQSDPSPLKTPGLCPDKSKTVKPMVHKRQIHEISSDEDNGDDDRTFYEASPLRAKAPRLMNIPNSSRSQDEHPPQGPNARFQAPPPPSAQSSRTFIDEETAPIIPRPPHGVENMNTPSLPPISSEPISAPFGTQTHDALGATSLHPNHLDTIILRIYLPNDAPATRTYIPIRLRSITDTHDLFRQAATVCECGVQDICMLKMFFDWERLEEGGKGVLAVKRDVLDSFGCFLEGVKGAVKEGREGGVGVEVVVD